MSIYRVYGANEWRSMTGAEIADGMNTPAAIKPVTLLVFLGLALAAGADPAELDKLGEKWGGDYIKRAERTLEDGDLAGLNGLMTMAVGIAAPTKAALQSVIDDLSLTAGQANWSDEDGDPPAEFTAEWVTAQLEEAGYTWDGSAWVRA
jgi:hypothetical protein